MAAGDAYVFPGFLTPILTQLFFLKPPTTFLTCFCGGDRRKYARKKSRLNRESNSQSPGHETVTFTTEPPGRRRQDFKALLVPSADRVEQLYRLVYWPHQPTWSDSSKCYTLLATSADMVTQFCRRKSVGPVSRLGRTGKTIRNRSLNSKRQISKRLKVAQCGVLTLILDQCNNGEARGREGGEGPGEKGHI